MSKTILLNHSNWHFTNENPGIPTAVMGEAITLPHTWNAVDGQDGGLHSTMTVRNFSENSRDARRKPTEGSN